MKVVESRADSLYTPPILTLLVVVAISYPGVGFLSPLYALYMRDIGASSVDIGLMTSAFLLAGFLAASPLGWASDMYRHRSILWADSLFMR
jgi:MFS family permease